MAKEIDLTPTQYEELKVLMGALQNPISQAGTTSAEIKINGTKVEYSGAEVKFTLSSAS